MKIQKKTNYNTGNDTSVFKNITYSQSLCLEQKTRPKYHHHTRQFSCKEYKQQYTNFGITTVQNTVTGSSYSSKLQNNCSLYKFS
jgi:hypothetical protein